MTIRPPPWEDWEHPDWSGETVFILGGGPSLAAVNPEALKHHPVMAVNEAGLTFAPWADILFWSDIRWVQWNAERMHLHRGDMRYTCQKFGIDEIPGARLVRFRHHRPDGSVIAFEEDPRCVAGHDGGSKCINLAYHTGARRAVLLGFDMHDLPMDRWRDGNWHSAHQAPPLEGQRARFREAHERMAAALPAGFEVLNATPGSALTCWPMIELEEIL